MSISAYDRVYLKDFIGLFTTAGVVPWAAVPAIGGRRLDSVIIMTHACRLYTLPFHELYRCMFRDGEFVYVYEHNSRPSEIIIEAHVRYIEPPKTVPLMIGSAVASLPLKDNVLPFKRR